jgi:hypothetical protein
VIDLGPGSHTEPAGTPHSRLTARADRDAGRGHPQRQPADLLDGVPQPDVAGGAGDASGSGLPPRRAGGSCLGVRGGGGRGSGASQDRRKGRLTPAMRVRRRGSGTEGVAYSVLAQRGR